MNYPSGKTRLLFLKAVRLVWECSPGWAGANIFISVFRSIFPLALVYLIKKLVDNITLAAGQGGDISSNMIIWYIFAVVVIIFLDEAATSLGNFVRKKQSYKLESYMHKLLHSKSIQLDL